MAIFDPFWAVLGCFGLFWAVLGCFEGVLGSFWGVLGLFWAVLGCFGRSVKGAIQGQCHTCHCGSVSAVFIRCYASRTNLFQSM